MRKQLLFVIFASALVSAQTAPQPTQPSPVEIPPTAPVITIHGLCPDKPAGPESKSAGCETVVTRADFEHLVQTLSPTMAPQARQSLATDYARMLVVSAEARKRGIENTQHYRDLLEFLKMQLLGQELMRSLQEQAKPSPAEVEKVYNDNPERYEQISVKRLFIPRNRPAPAATPGSNTPAPQPVTDAELFAQAEKLGEQLVAGADFDKLEKQVYESAGFKTPPPPTAIPNWPHDAVPATQQTLFQLKPKEFSKVMIEPAGAYVFQLEELKRTPFEQVKPQIESTMTSERLRAMMDSIMTSAKSELNPAYFRMVAEGGDLPTASRRPPRPPLPNADKPVPQAAPAPK